MGSEEGKVLIYSIVGFFGGLYLFYKGFTWLRLKRLIENMPTSKIRGLAMGLAEIYGNAVPYQKKILKSPFNGKDCVYYRYSIEEYRRSGKSSHWVTVKKGSSNEHFCLEDDTGRVLVDLEGANIEISKDFEFTNSLSLFGKNKPFPSSISSFLTNNKLDMYRSRTTRYSEYVIEPDDGLYILGTAGDNPFVEEATAGKSAEDIMMQKGKHDKIYYISDKSERDVVKSYKWKSFGGIIGGALLSVICLAVILFILGLF